MKYPDKIQGKSTGWIYDLLYITSYDGAWYGRGTSQFFFCINNFKDKIINELS